MKFEMPGQIKDVDFADFHFEDHGWNYEVAKDIAAVLLSFSDIDDVRGYNDVEGVYYDSTVGTGGNMNMRCNSIGIQRVLLATLLASYSQKQHSHCYVSVFEYRCIVNLLAYLEDDYWPSEHQIKQMEKNIGLLKEFVTEFKQAYIQVEPGFVFELIKT
jgi:hypothetical protein